MADPKKGLVVGDFVVGPTVSLSTEDRHDSFRVDERKTLAEEDKRAAQKAGGADAPVVVNPLHPPPVAVLPRGEVDDAIDAARARLAGNDEPPIPIIFRDPITGELILGPKE